MIDLRPGSFQSIGLNDNLSIAFNVDIEDARGGDNDDSITGNDLVNSLWGGDGNDILDGYGANDMLYGMAGNDTYLYKMNDGSDFIDEMAGKGVDRIEVGLFLA